MRTKSKSTQRPYNNDTDTWHCNAT